MNLFNDFETISRHTNGIVHLIQGTIVFSLPTRAATASLGLFPTFVAFFRDSCKIYSKAVEHDNMKTTR